MAQTSVYISASTNRHSNAADCSRSSLIACGSGKLISLWDVTDASDRGFFETLPGHQGLITCIRFIRNDVLLSADDKGWLRCWRKLGPQWMATGSIQAHSKAVSSLCAHEQCIASGSSDAKVKIWTIVSRGLAEDDLLEVQMIPLQGRYPLSLAVSVLPTSKAVALAIGGTDKTIQIWTRFDDLFVRSSQLPGHEDWIRSLAFRPSLPQDESVVLASGSQDGTIRLWSIEPMNTQVSLQKTRDGLNDELLDAFEASFGDLVDAEEGGRQITMKRHIVTVRSGVESFQQFSITFDALLVGHEAGITSLSWRPSASGFTTATLLSTSTDSSLILWSPSTAVVSPQDGSSSMWINCQRFGDVGGQRLGGFVGGLWAGHGREVLAWGWGGGWRRWLSAEDFEIVNRESWREIAAVGGHCGSVKGFDWSPSGEYLISAGSDQTTRIHGAVTSPKDSGTSKWTWHELSRPQVHGHDLLDVAFLDPLKFISIADEKVARVFEAPSGFLRVIEGLGVAELAVDERERHVAASVPPLGLSNKASDKDGTQVGIAEIGSNRSIRRPFDAELASMTLWPEVEKVFGHGYELISLAVSNSRHLVATACKATTTEHAVIRIYEALTWLPVGSPLEGHSLTVTRIAFSPDDRFVLSVSRDRSWRLFESHEGSDYIPVAADKSHGRIIWDCAWAYEADVFATASRDKTVKVWRPESKTADKWIDISSINTKEAATAVAFSPADLDNRRRLAIGLETGAILVYSSPLCLPSNWRLDITLDPRIAHVDHIQRLAWRPTSDLHCRQLASCSEDGTLKILIVHIAVDVNDNPQ